MNPEGQRIFVISASKKLDGNWLEVKLRPLVIPSQNTWDVRIGREEI